MVLSKQYKKYYKELFNMYSNDLFSKLWGKDKCDSGEAYIHMYMWELQDMSENVSDYLLTLDKYDVGRGEESLANYLLFQMDGLGEVSNVGGAYEIAGSMLKAIRNRLSVNGVEHPLSGGSVDVEPVIIDGDVPKNYILIQEDGYFGECVTSKVVASSKDRHKLELLCNDRVRRLKSAARFVGFHERFDLYDAYRQLVDEGRKMMIKWKIEEVLEVQ